MRRLRAGDPAAMDRIVALYYRRLIGFARLHLGRQELAEEAAQEVFLSLWRQREQLRSASGVKPWLFVAMRRWLSRERSRPANALEVFLEDESAPPEPAIEGRQAIGLEQDRVQSILRRAIGRLADEDRSLITLRFYGDLKIQEISETLAMPMGSVGVKLGRALEKLRRTLADEGYTLEELQP